MSGEYGQSQPASVSAKDGSGGLVGGLRGFVFLHWLNVELLFVDESARRKGVGHRLLAAPEQKARELGARYVTLNMVEWQARELNLKQGYEEFGRIDSYIQSFYAAYMKKSLGS